MDKNVNRNPAKHWTRHDLFFWHNIRQFIKSSVSCFPDKFPKIQGNGERYSYGTFRILLLSAILWNYCGKLNTASVTIVATDDDKEYDNNYGYVDHNGDANGTNDDDDK